MRRGLAALALLVLIAALPAAALGHAERESYYPAFDPLAKTFGPAFGAPPKYRRTGPTRVVCKPDSRARLRRAFRGRGRLLRERLAELRRCRYRHIQAAVNAARSNERILVMPGVYREEPSRGKPDDDPRCASMKETKEGTLRYGPQEVASYQYQVSCPNAQNLIAITGDDPADADRRCDRRCNLQIEGRGRRPLDVVVENDQRKLNAIRADRADGFLLRNVTLQYSEANNVYVHETNGFTLQDLVTRWVNEYGVLSFVSDQGLYERIDAYAAGDSGVYPGSGPEDASPPGGGCRYGIEIRRVNSHHNNLGYSGTAGNGVWVHDSRFHHNSTGLVTDSIVPGHPGMPQDCAKWERNQIYSNNLDIYGKAATARCTDPQSQKTRPFRLRNPKIVCSTFPNPIGTGAIINGNNNIVRGNRIWDNWRIGVALSYFGLQDAIRGEDKSGQSDPPSAFDVNHGNQFTGNVMGAAPGGATAPNGVDFLWDGEGRGNCWSNNTAGTGRDVTFDARNSGRQFPACPQGSEFAEGDKDFQGRLTPCLTWDAGDYDNYPDGCGGERIEQWFVLPPKP